MKKYRAAGVREYWIEDSSERTIPVYRFDSEPKLAAYTFESTIPVGIYDGKCMIDFAAISS